MSGALTKEQAIELYESNFWESLAYVERARFQLSERRLCMPFDVFVEALERALGRSIAVVELLRADRLLAELTGDSCPLSVEEMLSLLPEEQRVLLAA